MGWDNHYGYQLYQSDPSGNYGGWKATCIGMNSAVCTKSFILIFIIDFCGQVVSSYNWTSIPFAQNEAMFNLNMNLNIKLRPKFTTLTL